MSFVKDISHFISLLEKPLAAEVAGFVRIQSIDTKMSGLGSILLMII